MLLQHFSSFAACDGEKACKTPVEIIFADKFSQVLEIKFADKFPKFFPARVFAGNLGVEPSERFHICSNIGNPSASLLFSNGFHISDSRNISWIRFDIVMGASKERLLPPLLLPA